MQRQPEDGVQVDPRHPRQPRLAAAAHRDGDALVQRAQQLAGVAHLACVTRHKRARSPLQCLECGARVGDHPSCATALPWTGHPLKTLAPGLETRPRARSCTQPIPPIPPGLSSETMRLEAYHKSQSRTNCAHRATRPLPLQLHKGAAELALTLAAWQGAEGLA